MKETKMPIPESGYYKKEFTLFYNDQLVPSVRFEFSDKGREKAVKNGLDPDTGKTITVRGLKMHIAAGEKYIPRDDPDLRVKKQALKKSILTQQPHHLSQHPAIEEQSEPASNFGW